MNKNVTESTFIREFAGRSKNIKRKIAFSDGNDIRLIKALDYFQDYNNSSFYLTGSPFNDLSRGCLVEDIATLISMTLMQLKGMEDAGLI